MVRRATTSDDETTKKSRTASIGSPAATAHQSNDDPEHRPADLAGYVLGVVGEGDALHLEEPPRHAARVVLPLVTIRARQPRLFAKHHAKVKREGDHAGQSEKRYHARANMSCLNGSM